MFFQKDFQHKNQKMKKRKHNIIPQMFDVKPKEISGDFDIEKLNKKYFPVVELGASKRRVIKKKRSPIVMPAKWDISENEESLKRKALEKKKKDNLKIISAQANKKKVFQLNQFNQKKEIPAFISVNKKKFLGASKPFLNQSFDYSQEFYKKNNLNQESSVKSLSKKFGEWQKEKQGEKKRKEDRIARRQARRLAMAEEERAKIERIKNHEEQQRKLQLAKEIRAQEKKSYQKRLRKIALAERREKRKERINNIFSIFSKNSLHNEN
ncbi:MAG: hypothetical protein PF549_03700 [Patescibacteria group bacterium]|nr:hypothetical protein [Patescibacteria group bacterium]